MHAPSGFRSRLLLANLAVIALGSLVVLLSVSVLAPSLFDAYMGRAMGSIASDMTRTMDGVARGSFQDAVQTALIVAISAGIVGALVFSLWLSTRVTRPIARLADASRRMAAGHYGERVRADADDEIGRLADSFNLMAASLQATERRRAEMVTNVSHELRTPLTTLDGYLEGLEDGVIRPAPETWALLRNETSRLKRLVDDLQEVWRTEEGRVQLRTQAVDARRVVEGAAQRFAADACERGIIFRIDIPAALPPIRADPGRLAQVLDRYLANALRYGSAKSQVVLRAHLEAEGVTLSIADQGQGLTREQCDLVFERFYRAEPSRSRALGGSGMGLSVARALALSMGGRVWAESDGPGSGATFSIWLPRA